MILTFADHDGDPIAVDSALIVGLSVGAITGPHKPETSVTVTLIWTTGPQPFMVAAPFADVLRRWTESRGETLAPRVHPGTTGWELQYPDGTPPSYRYRAGSPS
jgi:hypothetical protein